MGKVGRGDEMRYMGVCSDGFGRTRVDHEHDGGYAEAKTREKGWGVVRKWGKHTQRLQTTGVQKVRLGLRGRLERSREK